MRQYILSLSLFWFVANYSDWAKNVFLCMCVWISSIKEFLHNWSWIYLVWDLLQTVIKLRMCVCVSIIFNMKATNLKINIHKLVPIVWRHEHNSISTEEYLVTVNGCAIFRPLQTGNKMQIFFFLSEFYLGGNIKR